MGDVELLPLPAITRYTVCGDIAYPIYEDADGSCVDYDDHVAAMRTYARANMEALRAEVERANSLNERVSVCRDHVADIVDGPCVICALDAAEARADKLEEALRRYGQHDDTCEVLVFGQIRCTCGFSAAIQDQEDGNG